MNGDIKTGVLLVNLGTPDAPTAGAIRRYLKQFLSDPRVVELPRWLWLPVLYGIILPLRPRRLVEAYEKVWTAAGSPLMAISRAQCEALQQELGPHIRVELAMSYGEPSIPRALKALDTEGVGRVVVLPLYPQYSATTTAAVFDGVFQVFQHSRRIPELRTIASYATHPQYIAALADSVRAHWETQGRVEHLLMSFHSIPQRYVAAGDPYQRECEATAQQLALALNLEPAQWSISYQSRLGREPWLQPYTDVALPQLAGRGVREVDVICPGFAADCLETLEEVAIRYAELFVESGGRRLRYIPALNDSAPHVRALSAVLRSAL